tara:strand:- start:39 stop:1430 length:1392 start_codon:yes stop_codon:yes gene_type:complete
MAAESLKFNMFEMYSTVDDAVSVSLMGSGNPVIEYRESVFMPYVEIVAHIIDTGNTLPADEGADEGIGLLDAGLAQGTETILFSIQDEQGHKIDLTNKYDLRVASVTGASQSFKKEVFKLTIVSTEAFNNTLVDNRCTGQYSGRISDIVRALLKDNLKSPKQALNPKAQKMRVDESLNEYHAWGNEDYPFELILKLQQLAIPNIVVTKKNTTQSAQGNTAGFLFWQTSEGYQFRSLDKLFDTEGKIIRRYIENSKGDDSLPPSYDGKILWSNMEKNVDALNQFETGAWSSIIQVFNPLTKQFPTTSLASEGTGNGISAGKNLPHINPDYLDSDGDPLPTIVQYNEAQVGGTIIGDDDLDTQIEKDDVANYSVEDVTLQAHQNYAQKMTVSMDIVIDADLSLHAGDMIFCEFPQLSTKKTLIGSKDRKSGIYMIADLCHYGEVGNSFTGLHLVRDSYGVKSQSS